ncbi:hypothetical protein HDE_04529 [Halotydeus destructor]|nr:hypothetical protein HDE_04529 [Halotydeus destructor]
MIQGFILATFLAVAQCISVQWDNESSIQGQNVRESARAGLSQSLGMVDESQMQVEMAISQLEAQLAAQVQNGALTRAEADERLASANANYVNQVSSLRQLISQRGQSQLAEISALVDTIDSDQDALAKVDVVVQEANQDRDQLARQLALIVAEASGMTASQASSGRAWSSGGQAQSSSAGHVRSSSSGQAQSSSGEQAWSSSGGQAQSSGGQARSSSGGLGGLLGGLAKPVTGLVGLSGGSRQAVHAGGRGFNQGLSLGGKNGFSENVDVGFGLDGANVKAGKLVTVGLLGQGVTVDEQVKIGLDGLDVGQKIDGELLGQEMKSKLGLKLGKEGLGLDQGLSLGGNNILSAKLDTNDGIGLNLLGLVPIELSSKAGLGGLLG